MSDEGSCLVSSSQHPASLNNMKTGLMRYTDGQYEESEFISAVNESASTRQSEHGSPQAFIEYNEDILRSQFHADAINQTSFGKFQIFALFGIGFGLIGQALQFYSIYFILHYANMEFCIDDSIKPWLHTITLLGYGFGNLFWGGLADRTGRRRALLSCLVVGLIFSAIAAFMPTFGPFMMVRFCSSFGLGGVIPMMISYLSEVTSSSYRARVLSLTCFIGFVGCGLGLVFVYWMVPWTTNDIILELKDHFGSWRKNQLLILLPIIGSIISLFWLPESPRYLLENGSEVKALGVYQKMFHTNRSKGTYSLTELEMPANHRSHFNSNISVLGEMAKNIKTYFKSYIRIFNNNYMKQTVLLIICATSSTFVFQGLSIFSIKHLTAIDELNYQNQANTKYNVKFDDIHFNLSLENINYVNSSFVNCTFARMYFNHVQFIGCNFTNSEFTNIRAGRTKFINSTFNTIRFIDTDLTDDHFDGCVFNDTTKIRLRGQCRKDYDFNTYQSAIFNGVRAIFICGLFSILIIGECLARFNRCRVATYLYSFGMIGSLLYGLIKTDGQYYSGIAQAMILGALLAILLITAESYVTTLRCTAIGTILFSANIGAVISVNLYAYLPALTTKFASIISTTFLAVPLTATIYLIDPCPLV